jgi:formylglycine-generating enzyme required for sulfatase activity
MVLIPGGEFRRGRTFPWVDAELKYSPTAFKDDIPVRSIHVDSFFMDESEVTNERYAAFVKARKLRPPYHWIKGEMPAGKGRHPVVNVSWEDASAFCAAEGKRLPTEAEWEHACKGGVDGRMFPWGDSDPNATLVHYDAPGPTPVCSKPRSDFGLCDIAGNVWEWTADWYDRRYYEVSPARNPSGPEQGLYRVLRGGSWFDQGKLFLTCCYRSWARAAERSPVVGFRCVKPAEGTSQSLLSTPVTIGNGGTPRDRSRQP